MKLQFILRGLPTRGFVQHASFRTCVIQVGPTILGEFARDLIFFVDRFSPDVAKDNYVLKYNLKRLT
jgi:hypothetical protein